MKAKTEGYQTLRQAVRGALLAPRSATFGALVSQHPITLAWEYFNHDDAPNTDGELWSDMLRGGIDDLPYVWIDHTQASEARTAVLIDRNIDYMVELIVAPYDDERMLIELTESHGKMLELLDGVLDISNIRELSAIQEIIDIHGTELFDWVEEYMIDHENNGEHRPTVKAFVNGIRYFVFYHLAGKDHGKTRVTYDMVNRLGSIAVGMTADAWGATLNRGDASEKEAKAFRDMIKHGITEERIERLQAIDYIIEE